MAKSPRAEFSSLTFIFFGWFWCRHLKPSGEKVEEHNSGESGSSGHCPGPRPLTPPATELENEISESIRVSEKISQPPCTTVGKGEQEQEQDPSCLRENFSASTYSPPNPLEGLLCTNTMTIWNNIKFKKKLFYGCKLGLAMCHIRISAYIREYYPHHSAVAASAWPSLMQTPHTKVSRLKRHFFILAPFLNKSRYQREKIKAACQYFIRKVFGR